MSVEAAIYEILSGDSAVTVLIGSRSPRIYPQFIPEGKDVPAVVFSQVSSIDVVSCAGHGNPRDDRVQVTSWAATPEAARTLAEAVRAAMLAASGTKGSVTVRFVSIIDEGDTNEIDPENEQVTRDGKRQDYRIAYEA